MTSLIGASVLVGWAFHVPILVTWFPGYVTLKANTAVCFLAAGIALFERHRHCEESRGPLAALCASLVLAVGTLTLVEYVFGWNLGIDQLLVHEENVSAGTSHPGRMAPNTAVAFVFLGLALHAVCRRSDPAWRTAQALTLSAMLLVGASLIGYVYRAHVLVGLFSLTRMAVHTIVAFVALGVGMILLSANHGWMAELTMSGPGRVVAQRLLPAALVIPAVIGMVTLTGYRTGFYDPAFVAAIMAVAETLSFATLVWQCIRFLNQSERARTQASVDELTGLCNRRAFHFQAEEILSSTRRLGTSALLFFIDLDGMKQINDGLGHAVGDRALVETAGVLRATFRDGDAVARLGGDEFAVLSAKASMEHAGAILDRLEGHRGRLNAQPNREFTLRLSIGVTPYVSIADGSITDLLKRADALMYEQKRARRSERPLEAAVALERSG